MTVRKYSSRSQQTTLSSPITSTATTMTVVNGASIMGGKTLTGTQTYTVVIDPDTALEEIVDVTLYSSGNALTITRGVDGPTPGTGVAHSAGAVVRHMAIGRDYQEANDHIEATTGHGATGAVVGTTNTQVLTNKDLSSATNTLSTSVVTLTGTQTLTGKTLTSPTITGTGAIAGTFTGNLTGNVTGNVSGTSGSTTGNAATATALATGRTISLTGDVTGTTGSFNGTSDVTMTASIGTGVIVNADVNAAAAIDKTKISGTAVTVADTGTVTSTMIANDTIVNADINTSAQIAYSKINAINSIVDADINASAAITKTKISGTAITAADTGTVTSTMIADGTIVNADINAAAAIDWTKLGISSTVSSTEIGYVDGVTSAIQTQLDAKLPTATAASTYAPLASPALTGVPTAPTAAANTNTTQIATTAYVQTELTDLIGGAPGALDTLNELATALSNDASYSTTITTALATKLPLAGGTMTGAVAMGANKITGLGTPTVSTDASTKAYVDTMLPLAGGTMSGAIAMGTNKITGLGTPTTGTDAVTKAYADAILVGAPGNLTGPITSVGAATSIASQTGTGTKFVVDTSPTLVTPNIGVATATSVNGTTIPTSKTLVATDSTQYVVPSQTGNSGKYLTTDGTTSSWGAVAGYSAPTLGSTSIASGATVTNVDGLTVNSTTIPTSATLAKTADKLSAFAATTSAELAGVISDETGSGSLVFGTSPTITPAAGTTTTAATGAGYMGLPQNSTTTGSYTIAAADAGKHIYSTATRTVTIDSNANLALPIGTAITFIAATGVTVTIAITTDTMYLAGTGTTGSRTLAAFGMATAVKVSSTEWIISGSGLS